MRERNTEIFRGQRSFQMDRMRGPIRIFHFGQVNQQFAILDCHLPVDDDQPGMEIIQVIHQQDIRPAARGDHPDLTADAKMLGGVDGGHLQGCHRGKTLLDGMAQDAVHVAFVHQRGGVAVIAAQDEMARVELQFGDGLDPFGHIMPGGTVTQHGLHPLADARHGIFRAGALVVVFRAAGRVSMEGHAQDPARHSARR